MTDYTGRTAYPFYTDPFRETGDERYKNRTLPTNNMGEPDPVTVSFLQWLINCDMEQQEMYRLYREYYEGEHPTLLTDRMREFLEIDNNVTFKLNVCPVVVDVPAERLQVVGFESAVEDSQLGGEEGILWDWWTLNRMDGVQNDIHKAAIRDGDTYALVEWDSERGQPIYSHEMANDGTSGITIRYRDDVRGEIAYAAKKWRIESTPQQSGAMRLNVYYPDAIYKFIATGRGWEAYQEEGQEWPIQWRDRLGRPLGVPIVHFKESAGGYDFGKSRLEDIIPCQDALNKSVIDEMAAADTQAFRMLFKMGGGDPQGLAVAPGRVIYDSDPDTKWDSIEGGGLDGLSQLVADWVMRIAQISRTPLSYFQVTGQVASGETQKADDKGLVSLVETSSVGYGNAWENLMKISIRLSNAFGGTNYNEDEIISTEWAEFDRVDRNEEERKAAETKSLKANTFISLVNQSVPRRTAAIVAGYTQEEADELATTDRILPSDRLAPEV